MPLPKDTADDVVLKAKDCPVLTARKVRAGGSLDVQLSDAFSNPVVRLPNPLGRPVEGLIVTRQKVDGSVLSFGPGDPEYDNLSPPVDPTKEIVAKASALGMTVRLLAY